MRSTLLFSLFANDERRTLVIPFFLTGTVSVGRKLMVKHYDGYNIFFLLSIFFFVFNTQQKLQL